jgi:hypothetical protein
VNDSALAFVSTTVSVALGLAMLAVDTPKRAVRRIRARYRRF